jgi:hypothetical protein
VGHLPLRSLRNPLTCDLGGVCNYFSEDLLGTIEFLNKEFKGGVLNQRQDFS